MLIRLLVVLLTVVGPLPFRVCTCAASGSAPTPADVTAPANVAAVKSCRCGHRLPAKGTDPAGDGRTSTDAHRCGESHPTGHDRDCPALNPVPLVRDTGTPPAPDAPTDSASAPAAVWVESVPVAGATGRTPSERPRAPKLPLFITLLALRN